MQGLDRDPQDKQDLPQATTGRLVICRHEEMFAKRPSGGRKHGVYTGPHGKDTKVVRRQETFRMRGMFRSWPLLGFHWKGKARQGQLFRTGSSKYFQWALDFHCLAPSPGPGMIRVPF